MLEECRSENELMCAETHFRLCGNQKRKSTFGSGVKCFLGKCFGRCWLCTLRIHCATNACAKVFSVRFLHFAYKWQYSGKVKNFPTLDDRQCWVAEQSCVRALTTFLLLRTFSSSCSANVEQNAHLISHISICFLSWMEWMYGTF